MTTQTVRDFPVTVSVTCPRCAEDATVTVMSDQLRAWKSGTLIQNAMPDVSVDDRERLQTGICPTCWDEMFKGF